MSNRALTTLAYAAVVVFCTAAAGYFGMLRERADIAVELARLDQQLTSEFTQSVRFAALLPDHRQVREAALLGDPGQTESDALNKLAIKTGRLAIIVSGPDGQILATGLRNPDSAPPIEKLPVALAQSLSSNQLSRRFVFTESDGWLFEAGKAISGLKQERLGQVHAYQPLEDFAQIWNALLGLTGEHYVQLRAHSCMEQSWSWSGPLGFLFPMALWDFCLGLQFRWGFLRRG